PQSRDQRLPWTPDQQRITQEACCAASGERLTQRADLKHLAVIAGFKRNPELAAAAGPGHDRRHRDNLLAPAVVERGLHACLLAELDQVAGSGERQLEAAALAALQRLARRHP